MNVEGVKLWGGGWHKLKLGFMGQNGHAINFGRVPNRARDEDYCRDDKCTYRSLDFVHIYLFST